MVMTRQNTLALCLDKLLLVPHFVSGFSAIDNKVCDGHVERIGSVGDGVEGIARLDWSWPKHCQCSTKACLT